MIIRVDRVAFILEINVLRVINEKARFGNNEIPTSIDDDLHHP